MRVSLTPAWILAQPSALWRKNVYIYISSNTSVIHTWLFQNYSTVGTRDWERTDSSIGLLLCWVHHPHKVHENIIHDPSQTIVKKKEVKTWLLRQPDTKRQRSCLLLQLLNLYFFIYKKEEEDKSTEKLPSVFSSIPRTSAASLLGSPLS